MIRDIMKYSEKISNRLNDLLTRTYDAWREYNLAQDKGIVSPKHSLHNSQSDPTTSVPQLNQLI